MENLTELIGNLCSLLEDAIEEQEWDLVNTVAERLSTLYEEMDRSDYL